MAVVALPNISPRVRSPDREAVTWGKQSLTAVNRSPFNGVTTTLGRPGSYRTCTLVYENLYIAERAQLEQFLDGCDGQANRFYLPDYSRLTLRGTFPTSELLTNNFFASGTTGWTAGGGAALLTASDGILRVTRADAVANYQARQAAIAVTQYAPYIARAVLLSGRGLTGLSLQLTDGTVTVTSAAAAGYKTAASIPLATTVDVVAFESTATGGMAGDYFELGYSSLSRGALVDNGTNLLLRSDEFSNAAWVNTRTTDAANSATAPDGTVTADSIIEDATASNTHQIAQDVTVSSSTADYCFGVALKPSTRTWARVLMFETTGLTAAAAYFNLTTGAVGTLTTGANWSNVRAFTVSMGGGYFACYVVGRKTNAATTLTAALRLATADNTDSYSGDGASLIFAWRGTLAQSSVPMRLVQTVAAASTGTLQTGSALYLKGLPVSTSGLLVAADPFEVVTSATTSEFKCATKSLNSDAAGLGHIQFESPIRNSPADSGAVILQRPLMRAMLDSNSVKWTEKLGGFCDLEFTAVEDLAA